MLERIVVTTTHTGGLTEDLKAFLAETGWEFVSRNRRSLAAIREATRADAVVVWRAGAPVLYLDDKVQFFFHPSMAKNRLSQHRKGLTIDVMQRIVGVQEGDRFLDCTLGLGADAIVASYLVGAGGRVVGLESSPVVAAVVKWGLRSYITPMDWLQQAIGRIEVRAGEHLEYLQSRSPGAFDIVFFDPMFRSPVNESQAISPLRLIADQRPLVGEAILAATRIARHRVVIKERRDSPEFERLGVDTVLSGESSRVAYGIIETRSR